MEHHSLLYIYYEQGSNVLAVFGNLECVSLSTTFKLRTTAKKHHLWQHNQNLWKWLIDRNDQLFGQILHWLFPTLLYVFRCWHAKKKINRCTLSNILKKHIWQNVCYHSLLHNSQWFLEFIFTNDLSLIFSIFTNRYTFKMCACMCVIMYVCWNILKYLVLSYTFFMGKSGPYHMFLSRY